MKQLLYIVAFSTLLFACGNEEESQITAADSSGVNQDNLPFFEFEEEVKDFGEITQGESVKTIFKFKNVGKSNLIISSAQGSCGCTVPQWPKEPIKPGEKGESEVVFNSEGKSGLQNKTITLVANTIPNTKVIALKGEILAPSSK